MMGASGCESGNLPGLVEAGTLREKECGDGPRYSREAFLSLRRDLLLARLAERAWVAQVVDARRQSAGPSVLRVNKRACATCRGFLCWEMELGRGWRLRNFLCAGIFGALVCCAAAQAGASALNAARVTAL